MSENRRTRRTDRYKDAMQPSVPTEQAVQSPAPMPANVPVQPVVTNNMPPVRRTQAFVPQPPQPSQMAGNGYPGYGQMVSTGANPAYHQGQPMPQATGPQRMVQPQQVTGPQRMVQPQQQVTGPQRMVQPQQATGSQRMVQPPQGVPQQRAPLPEPPTPQTGSQRPITKRRSSGQKPQQSPEQNDKMLYPPIERLGVSGSYPPQKVIADHVKQQQEQGNEKKRTRAANTKRTSSRKNETWQEKFRSLFPQENGKKKKQDKPFTFGYQPWMKYVVLVIIVAIAVVVINSISHNRQLEQTKAELTSYVTNYDQRFCEGVYVDGISLGGMTQIDAMDVVVSRAQKAREEWHVTLQYGDKSWKLDASQVGISLDVKDALNDAWAKGHTGTIEERKAEMDALKSEPFYAFTATPGGDTSVIDALLAEIAAEIYVEPKNASLKEFVATRTDPFEFNQEVVGRSLDTTELKELLYQKLSSMESGTVTLEPDYEYPSITVEYLKNNLYTERFTAYTDISTSSDDDRNDNITRAMELINGTVVLPGEKFSFNDVVGERSTRNGFKPAIEYVYGRQEMGIGGGVCQASTTVYQAAVCSGMEIVKRSPHSMVVNYSKVGEDATVYWNSNHKVDLQFRNNTGYPIYIKAHVQSKQGNAKRKVTRVTIYGVAMGAGVSYGFDCETEILPKPEYPEYRFDEEQQYVVFDSEAYVYQKAKEGSIVNSYQVQYLNKEEVGRTFLATDTFDAKQEIIYVGITQDPNPAVTPYPLFVEEAETPMPV